MERMTHVDGAMNGRYVSGWQVWMRRVENMPCVLKWGGDLETARNYSFTNHAEVRDSARILGDYYEKLTLVSSICVTMNLFIEEM